jgi:transposase-like protein
MFHPPFCPYTRCKGHHTPPATRWYVRFGTYTTDLKGTIQRYKCRLCGRGFSEQTFNIDYYAKRGLHYQNLIRLMASCCSIRAAGRYFGCDRKTVSNKIMRFARQSAAVHMRLEEILTLQENLVSDGFQSFWVSQYFPNNLNILVGEDSQYLYAFNGVTLRRSGRMTEKQKKKRKKLEKTFRADGKGIQTSFTYLLDTAARLTDRSEKEKVCVITDQHISYMRAVKHHGAFGVLEKDGKAEHLRYSSEIPRTVRNPLFSVNYYDREMRKDLSEHVRESTRFAREANHTMERLAVYGFYHNFLKRYRIGTARDDERTHAAEAGMKESVVKRVLQGVYTRRAFLSRLPFTTNWAALWLRVYETPLAPVRAYLPRYMLA